MAALAVAGKVYAGDHDLVAGPDVEREVRQVQRRRAVRAADGEGGAGRRRQRPLVLRQHRPERQVAAREDALHGRELGLAQVRPRQAHLRRIAHAAPDRLWYHARVRSSPSSRSTCGSHFSSSRDFVMSGMRISTSE